MPPSRCGQRALQARRRVSDFYRHTCRATDRNAAGKRLLEQPGISASGTPASRRLASASSAAARSTRRPRRQATVAPASAQLRLPPGRQTRAYPGALQPVRRPVICGELHAPSSREGKGYTWHYLSQARRSLCTSHTYAVIAAHQQGSSGGANIRVHTSRERW